MKIFNKMTNTEIVNEMARTREVERIVAKYCSDDTKEDLIQDIYINLLQSPKTVELYLKRQLNFYIVGIITKSLFSSSSPYYSRYKKFRTLCNEDLTSRTVQSRYTEQLY